MKKRIIEIAVKMLVAALTAFLTAITTTSCMGYGPYKLRAAGSPDFVNASPCLIRGQGQIA